MKIVFAACLAILYCHVISQVPSWQNKDLGRDTIFGVSLDRAYQDLLQNRKAYSLLVAVIDDGIDTSHEDLRQVLWHNSKETQNKKDDDHNGYADDLYGWSFIGGKTANVQYDNLEIVRLIRRDRDFYDSLFLTEVPPKFKDGFFNYRKIRNDYDDQFREATTYLDNLEAAKKTLDSMTKKISKDSLALADVISYEPANSLENQVKQLVLNQFKNGSTFGEIYAQLSSLYEKARIKVEYNLNLNYYSRYIVGDNYINSAERFYGNNNVYGINPDHGTHVAGIIAAVRNNYAGIDGIADRVGIMAIRVVPDGDERDKDVANAIRYAVDNGAKIINMSFGKPYSSDKQVVDEAVKYAVTKDVLIVHAAGNEGKDLDHQENKCFPNKHYADNSGEADSWITVGASGWKDDSTLVAPFSNYGKTSVDVFAPGVDIYSCVPGNRYKFESGTSMAAPVVSGIAALIREYYPKLKASQVKGIIVNSVVKRDILKEKCVSSGVVNLYNALKLAAKYRERTTQTKKR